MIKSIELKNIQSHKETKLDFDAGVNCIVGSSNNGKSAILRGLYWVVYNRPLGIDTLASHWALTEKGNLKDEMSVTVVNDNGEITRRRDKDSNQYIVNGFVQDVVKSDVPEPVSMILDLKDTNIQKQLDEPFLLSKSAGEVAKYFNKTVNLDVIDKVLSNAESSKRKAKQETERTEKEIKELEEKQNSYSWLESAGALIEEYEKIEKEADSINEEIESLFISLEKYNSMMFVAEKYSGVSEFKNKVERIEKLNSELDDVCQDGKELSVVLNKYKEVKENKYPDFSHEKEMIEKVESGLDDLVDNVSSEMERLLAQITNKKDCENIIVDNRKKIEEYKKQLPKVCPVCGQPWDCCKEI